MNAPFWRTRGVVPRTERATHEHPLLFIHGAYVSAWCWEEHFLPWFAPAAAGRFTPSRSPATAAAASASTSTPCSTRLRARRRRGRPPACRPPVLVGHSMGRMVVQKYLRATRRARRGADVRRPAARPTGLRPDLRHFRICSPTSTASRSSANDVDNRQLRARRSSISAGGGRRFCKRYYRLTQPGGAAVRSGTCRCSTCRAGRRAMHRVPMQILGAEHDA